MSYANRGMALENMIDHSNQTYLNKKIAQVNKIPTPWSVNYNRQTGKVHRAYPQKKGTVDFIGVSDGVPLAFDAKTTKEKTRFPLSNVEEHQVEYLWNHTMQGGISFFIIYFEHKNEVYYMPIETFVGWWDQQFEGGRKSIPYEWFTNNVERIYSKNGVIVDYLENCQRLNSVKGKPVDK